MEWTIHRKAVADREGRTFQVWTCRPGFGAGIGYTAFRVTPGVLRTPTVIQAWSERDALRAAGYQGEDLR
jgi:hypothetical protein